MAKPAGKSHCGVLGMVRSTAAGRQPTAHQRYRNSEDARGRHMLNVSEEGLAGDGGAWRECDR